MTQNTSILCSQNIPLLHNALWRLIIYLLKIRTVVTIIIFIQRWMNFPSLWHVWIVVYSLKLRAWNAWKQRIALIVLMTSSILLCRITVTILLTLHIKRVIFIVIMTTDFISTFTLLLLLNFMIELPLSFSFFLFSFFIKWCFSFVLNVLNILNSRSYFRRASRNVILLLRNFDYLQFIMVVASLWRILSSLHHSSFNLSLFLHLTRLECLHWIFSGSNTSINTDSRFI